LAGGTSAFVVMFGGLALHTVLLIILQRISATVSGRSQISSDTDYTPDHNQTGISIQCVYVMSETGPTRLLFDHKLSGCWERCYILANTGICICRTISLVLQDIACFCNTAWQCS